MGTDDTAEVSTEQGKLRLFVGIDRTSKFVFARLVESAGKMEAAQFLRDLVEAAAGLRELARGQWEPRDEGDVLALARSGR